MTDLFRKYDRPTPRYTSYPPVPFWNGAPAESEWFAAVSTEVNHSKEVSLYIHLPFCEQLCTFCGCNKVITKNHDVEGEYIEALLSEWKLYQAKLPAHTKLSELHLGGGTPTFFSPANLKRLLSTLFESLSVSDDASLSFEAHPNVMSLEHVTVLSGLGFRRVSFGIQDFDAKVQTAINRKQSVARVRQVTDWARANQFNSVNFDLIYGLPFQTSQSMETTLKEVAKLRPDRIAFYSYAHVPWIKPSQRRFSEVDLPEGEVKRALYLQGRDFFLREGYVEIGMDHFALPEEALAVALKNKRLHRNFMGYTLHSSTTLIGLGVSSISECPTLYAQNSKVIDEYYAAVREGKLALAGGHRQSQQDLNVKKHVLNLMCFAETTFHRPDLDSGYAGRVWEKLSEITSDNLVTKQENTLLVTEAGKPFLRNICTAFDEYFDANGQQKVFSKSV